MVHITLHPHLQDTCIIDAAQRTAKMDITCDALEVNRIDWDRELRYFVPGIIITRD